MKCRPVLVQAQPAARLQGCQFLRGKLGLILNHSKTDFGNGLGIMAQLAQRVANGFRQVHRAALRNAETMPSPNRRAMFCTV